MKKLFVVSVHAVPLFWAAASFFDVIAHNSAGGPFWALNLFLLFV